MIRLSCVSKARKVRLFERSEKRKVLERSERFLIPPGALILFTEVVIQTQMECLVRPHKHL